jgi:ABC-type polysaccharide/polyol phosphate export permease
MSRKSLILAAYWIGFAFCSLGSYIRQYGKMMSGAEKAMCLLSLHGTESVVTLQ